MLTPISVGWRASGSGPVTGELRAAAAPHVTRVAPTPPYLGWRNSYPSSRTDASSAMNVLRSVASDAAWTAGSRNPNA